MDDVVTNDQGALLDASSRFMEKDYPLEAVRRQDYSSPARSVAYRRQAGELGWYSMLVPEDLGGGNVSGNGVLDAALIAFRRGRALQPGAFVGTNVVAYALAVAGSEQHQHGVLPTLISGEAAAAWLWSDRPTTVRATTTGGGFSLSGGPMTACEVEHDSWLLVNAIVEGDTTQQFLVSADSAGLEVVPVESLDLSRRFSRVTFHEAQIPAASAVGTASNDLADELLALAATLLVAESVGAMERDFGLTVQYAKDRIAFGRPIGSFQAVKHQLADTSLALELSKSVALAAATTLGEDTGYHRESASIAKSFVGDASIDLAQTCFQIFGGIGYTWEHDQHLFLRRLTTDAALYGNSSWHRERLCQLAGV